MRYLVRVFYDGKDYFGYQRQPNVETIEGNIVTMLKRSDHIQSETLNNFKSASRTDKSVNAIGNVFAFDSEKKIILDQINAEGPKNKSIICWAFAETKDDFSPKFSIWKKYWYVLPLSYKESKNSLSLIELGKIFSMFEGKHDFRLFCRQDHRITMREIDKIEIFENSNNIVIEFVAQSFLWEQIRRIISYVLNFNTLSEDLQNTRLLLSSDNQIKDLNLTPADPRNLILIEHFYENAKWEISKKATEIILEKLKTKTLDLRRELSISSILYNFFELEDSN